MNPRVEIALYRTIAVVAGVGSWAYNLRHAMLGGNVRSFFEGAFASDASTSIAVDLMTMCIVLVAFIASEGRRHRIRGASLYVVAGLAIAMASAFPLFLVARRRALVAREARGVRAAFTPRFVLAPAVAAGALVVVSWFRIRAFAGADSVPELVGSFWLTDPARSWVFDLGGIAATFVVFALAEHRRGTTPGALRWLSMSLFGCAVGFPMFARALDRAGPPQSSSARRAAAILGVVLLLGAGVLEYRFYESGPGFGEDGLTSLTITCGDHVCDPRFGESPDTCRRDCAEPEPRVTGFYSDITRCPVGAELHVATSVDDVQATVRSFVQRGLRVKARGQGHSTGSGFCSDGGVVQLDRLVGMSELETFRGLETVVIEPGVTFERLGEYLHTQERSFGPFATGRGGLSVVGAMATGSHGSDARRPSTVGEQLVEVELVDPRGELRRFNRFDTAPDTWRALLAHDGALGVVVRARIDTEPDRKLRIELEPHRLDEFTTRAGLEHALRTCDYAFLNLMLESDRANLACGTVTDEPVTHERLTNFLFTPPVRSWELGLVRTAIHFTTVSHVFEGLLEKQILDGYTRSVGIDTPSVPGGIVPVGNRGVGWNHRIVNLPSFPYEVPYFAQIDYEVSVRVRDLPEIVRLVNAIFDRYDRTLPYTGIIVRFDRATDHALLAGNSLRPGVVPGEAIAHVELPTFVPFGYTQSARERYYQPSDESVREILARFPTARLHLGKNRPALFAHFATLGRDDAQRARFQAVVDAMDPFGVFANDHLRQMGIRWPREGEDFASYYFPPPTSTRSPANELSVPADVLPR